MCFTWVHYLRAPDWKWASGRPTPKLPMSPCRNTGIARQLFLGKLPLAASCATPTLNKHGVSCFWIWLMQVWRHPPPPLQKTISASSCSFLPPVTFFSLRILEVLNVCEKILSGHIDPLTQVRDWLIITQTNCILFFRHPQEGHQRRPNPTTEPHCHEDGWCGSPVLALSALQ